MHRYIVYVAGPLENGMNQDVVDQAVGMLRPVFDALGFRVAVTIFDEADMLLRSLPIPEEA